MHGFRSVTLLIKIEYLIFVKELKELSPHSINIEAVFILFVAYLLNKLLEFSEKQFLCSLYMRIVVLHEVQERHAHLVVMPYCLDHHI